MKNKTNPFGFTLLEMLTAMAIIAVMIGLLVPAISRIQDTARTVRQKAQFSAIEIALEAFSADTGEYPPSKYTVVGNNMPANANNTGYCGAQKLAEAIIGMDGFGFHPKSQWRSNGTADVVGKDGTAMPNTSIYHIGADIANFESADENLKARKGPYLELEKANAVKISDIYPTGGPASIFGQLEGNTFILADMFGNVKNRATGKKTGMPILYFRAETSNALLKPSTLGNFPWVGAGGTTQDAVYNVNENFPFYMNSPAGIPFHPMGSSAGRDLFYSRIANPNFTSPQRPYRASSFILLSAGADGVYGSTDDVYNIDENEK